MPSWWPKNSYRVTQQDLQKQQHKELNTSTFIDKKSSATRNNKKKLNKEKPKSFDEAISLRRISPRSINDFQASSISFSGAFIFSGFDMVAASKIVEKKAYPLPQPSGSPESTLKFDQNIVGFGSGMMLVSNTSSSASSSSCSDEHDLVHDHEDFGSFRSMDLNFNKQLDESRVGMNIQIESKVSTVELVQPLLYSAVEETKCNSSSRTSCPRSKVITIHASPQHPLTWVAGLESPTEKHENGWHPCHPLPLPPDSPIKTSQHLQSNWKKGKLLGRGTFGHVYAGFNSESGQMCAMKEVRVISDDQTSKECLKQLNQEIALLSELSHPNIVRYYGSKLGEDTLSVYLEYVSGGSIQKLLMEYGPFKEPVIQSYTRQILSGLAYLHGRNTVHRDIKGANILVDPNGDIKLADFGMAKHMSSCSLMLSFKGSPYWMAPEVIQNISGYSLAVDIWSLGCTIIEMATSKPPGSQYEGVAAIFKIANSKDFPKIPNYLSEDAQSFVKLCLQRDPSARPTAAQLLHHPFIQDQVTTGIAKVNFIDEAFSTLHRRHCL